MENIQQILNHPLTSHLHEKTTSQITSHISTFRTAIIDPYIISPLSFLLQSGTSDLVSIFILLLIFYISLRLLDYARRVIMWWISIAVKFVFYSSIILAGLYVYRVGIQAAGRDLGWVLGLVEGFVEDFHTRANAAAAAAANPSATGVSGWNGNGSPGGEGKWW